mmetsp:Transcript_1858/g.4440  ORF Transcript_1858/g.4440 Transcript_1858/m.4440 type:complete len:325 (-) Transcript_1858:162-1136(-)
MLYKASEVLNLQSLWQPVVFDEERPHCLDLDVALASISDVARFYAVPAAQAPGFLRELPEGSTRVDINKVQEKKAPPQQQPVVADQLDAAAGPAASTVSLYCFALVIPTGYEVSLMRSQLKKHAGLFGCNAYTVYSNEIISLSDEPPRVSTALLPGSLECPYGGQFHTAMNTEIFVRVWRRVFTDRTFAAQDWTVKVDADAVFLPGRLREHARMQHPGKKIFFNNCGFGLHGPVEVLSQAAVYAYEMGMSRCIDAKVSDWHSEGEDVFLRKCLGLLAVEEVDDFGLLSEQACGENPSPCLSGKVAFHPFKDENAWFTCLAQAER